MSKIVTFATLALILAACDSRPNPLDMPHWRVTCQWPNEVKVYNNLTWRHFSVGKHGTVIRHTDGSYTEYSPGVPCVAEKVHNG